MSCAVKPDKKDGRLVCAECKTDLPKGAPWCPKCGPMAVQPDDREPDYRAEMQLPAGVTCADCRHVKRCVGFGFSLPGCTSCDFWPSRFVRSHDETQK